MMIQFDKHFFSKEKHQLEMACKIPRLLPSGKALDFRKPLQARRVEQPEASTMVFFPVTMTNLNNFEVCVSILPKMLKLKPPKKWTFLKGKQSTQSTPFFHVFPGAIVEASCWEQPGWSLMT